MLSVTFEIKIGYQLYCTLSDGETEIFGGIDKNGLLFIEKSSPYAELMLRAMIDKLMDAAERTVYAKDEWGVDLRRFGFEQKEDEFTCSSENLKLPHDCKH